MEDKGTLWIDLTMLVHWQGQLTGIQRVEYNLARRFACQKDVKFCVFDKESRELYEYDFQNIQTKVESLNVISDNDVSSVQNNYGYLNSLRKVISPMIPRQAKQKIKAVYRKTKSRPASTASQPGITFNQTDKLLILSGDWSDEIFYTTLTALKQNSGLAIIQIVYDLLPAMQPAFFVPGMPQQVSAYMAAIFPICEQIWAISQATKKDIERFQELHDLPKTPVKVFRLGDDFAIHDPIKPALPIEPGHFLLCVGTIEARKNHLAIYYAIREAIAAGLDVPPVVIAGKAGWLVDNFIYLVKNDPIVSQKLILLYAPPDKHLAWLFQNCLLTIYPSFYEGWGLPIAESLFYGKLCLSSESSSMPEIAGELIDYFSPNDPKQMLELITKYLDKPKLLQAKEDKIRKNYKPTSWDRTFEQVLGILKQIN